MRLGKIGRQRDCFAITRYGFLYPSALFEHHT
jgi:hypothetical protein